jgi:hypothetical protein
MPNTTVWGNSGSSHRAVYHQGPARQVMVVHKTHDALVALKAQVCGPSNDLYPSDRRPSADAAHAANSRASRRERKQNLTRGLKASTEAARERAVGRLYPEISFAELQAINFAEQQVAMLHKSQVAQAEPQEAPVYHNNLSHIEAPTPQRVFPLVMETLRVVVPDRGFRAAIRKLSPFSERGYLKSGLPNRVEYGNPNLLYVGKYADPRPRDFSRATQDTSESDSQSISDLDESESQSVLNLDESEWLAGTSSTTSPACQDALSLAESVRIASITNLHGYYPGKRFYAPAEPSTTTGVSTTAEIVPTE